MGAAAVPAAATAGRTAAAAATQAGTAAAEGAQQRVRRVARGRNRRGSPGLAKSNRMLTISLVVLFATGLIRSYYVDQTVPRRQWWVSTTIVAAMLALFTDLAPKGGRYMAYVVIVGAMAANTVPILDAARKTEGDAATGTDPGPSTTPASDGTNPQLEPVFLRQVGGGQIPSGGPGRATTQFVSATRRPRTRARRPRNRGPRGRNVPTYNL